MLRLDVKKIVLATAAAVAALAFAAPALADTQELNVAALDTKPGALAPTLIDVAVPTTAAPTAKITVYVPTGYSLDLAGTSGVGFGSVTVNAKDTGGTNVDGSGLLTADDPAKYASDPIAQACAPGQHAAVWVLSVTLKGQALKIPVYIDPTTGAETALGAYVLQTCFASSDVPAASGGALLGGRIVDFGFLVIQKVRNPAAPVTSTWRALVTPYTAGTATQNSAGTVEVRSSTPIPFAIVGTKVAYSKQTKAVTITGKLVAGNGVAAGVPVRVDAGKKAKLDTLKPWAVAKTNAKGVFTIKHKLPAKLYAFLYVKPTSGPCDATLPSSAPGGCVLQSTAIELGPSIALKPKQ